MASRSATTAAWQKAAPGAQTDASAHSVTSSSRAALMPRWFKPAVIISIVMLAMTGFGQMPIYSRYYVSSIPGMGWTGDFYVTHLLHYLFATVFLALLGYGVAAWAMKFRSRFRVSVAGWVRILFYGGVVVTGLMRVLKNDPNFFFSPGTVMFMDIGHLAFVMLLGAAALVVRLRGRTPYLLFR